MSTPMIGEPMPGMEQTCLPVIGVCVLTYNSEEVILECLHAIERSLKDVSHETVVVDNHSNDCSASIVERHYPEIKVVRSRVNTGYARGNDLGAKYLVERGCKYIAFINPDVTVRQDTLANMESVLSEHSDAGCVGGIAISNGRVSKACFRTEPTFAERLWIYSVARDFPVVGMGLRGMIRRLEARHFIPTPPTAQPVYAVSGACIMFPADVFSRIGGFDEETFLFQEEFIISERLRREGYRVYGVPDGVYDHVHGHSMRTGPRRPRWCFIQSEQHLLRTYYKWSRPKRGLLWSFRCIDFAAGETVVGLIRLYKKYTIPRTRSPGRA